ncbi:MAG: pilus assembly protein PilM [Planctomycetota bacterium]
MPKNVGVGVDVGSKSVKIAKVKRKGHLLVLERLIRIPTRSPEETQASIISKLQSSHFSASSAAVGVSGRNSMIRYLHLPVVPDFRLKLLMDYELSELADKSTDTVSSDYKELNIQSEQRKDLTVITATVKDDNITDTINFCSAAGIDTASVLPSPFALYNAFIPMCQYEEKQYYLLIDIGAANTDIAIVRENILYFARSIGKGADDFTEALANVLKISLDEAENIKITEATLKISGTKNERDKLIADTLASTADRFFSVINSTIDFAKTQLKLPALKIDKVFLLGGGALLPGLSEHFSKSFGTTVTVGNFLEHKKEDAELQAMDKRLRFGDYLPPEDLSEASKTLSEYTCAIGLAVSEFDNSLIHLDLLPKPIKEKREFRHKTIFMYAAAIACVIFLITKFATAISASWNTNRVHETLGQISADCDDRIAQHKDMTEENKKIETAVCTIERITEINWFISNLLLLLRDKKIVSDLVKIDEFTLNPNNDTKKISVTLKGIIISERGNEFAILKEFRNNLKQTKLISDVVIDPSSTHETMGRFVFEMTLVPNPNK